MPPHIKTSSNMESTIVLKEDHLPYDGEDRALPPSTTTTTDASPIDAIIVQTNAVIHTVQFHFDQARERFTLDRPMIMTCILTVLASCLAVACLATCFFLAIAVITSPLWLPVTIITSPMWIFALFVSSPVWVTLLVITAFFVISTTCTIGTLVFFFGWPEEWLPSPKDNGVVLWFLDTRKMIEMHLIKFQAKLLLYAAGVGPAADTLFLIIDRIDIHAVRQRLSQVDIEKLKQFDPSELQSLIFEAIQSLSGGKN